MILGRVAWALVALVLVGCGHAVLHTQDQPHGKFTAIVARSLEREPHRPTGLPTAVLFGPAEAVGIDPRNGQRRWRRPLRAFGPPVSDGTVVVVPVRGHRLVALDGSTGATLWETALPGQALTGVGIGENRVVVTAIARTNRARSVVAGLSRIDGRRRWMRHADALLGVPAVAGWNAFVPLDHDVLVLGLASGRERARTRFGAHQIGRIERHGDALLAADQAAFFDLTTGPGEPYRVDGLYAPAFQMVDGLEPGMGHQDGIAWRLAPSRNAGAPREGVFLARRAVIAVRLDAKGRPVEPHWVHLRHDQREYVALTVTPDHVLLVDEDGQIVAIERASGSVALRHATATPTVGGTFVGRMPSIELKTKRAPARDDRLAMLIGVVEDPDPRLLPAQQLALDLLWRDEDPEVRALVHDVATGIVRDDDGPQTQALRRHARARMHDVWGPADRESLEALLQQLEFGSSAGNTEGLIAATRSAVKSGGPEVVPKLVALLLDPRTAAPDLVAVARALRDLGDSRAVPGVSEFVRHYHADPEVVEESLAVYYAVEFLLDQGWPRLPSRVDVHARRRAQETVQFVLGDRFTVPKLSAFVRERVPSWQ